MILTILNSEHMDKIFEKRRAEFEKQAPNNSSRLLLQKLQVPVERQQMSGTGNVKNQRKTAHLVDHLMDTASYGDDMELSVRKGRSRSTILPDSGSRISGEVTKAPRELITHPEHNSHLRRSSRTSGATRKASEHPFDASDDVHNDVPPYERFSKIHGLGLAWNKPLTYPKAGKKKITVEWSDLERLDEGEFLNDNLVGFYLRYLEQCLQDKRPDLAKRVYFFNTYFYATLTNAHKPKKSFNYEGVQKWTKYVDIFTYDYIIVPICEFSHWYMAIICNLPHLDRVVMLEEGSHFQTEIGSTKTANEHNEFAPPLSSPIDEMSQRDTTTLVDDEKEPDERDARNSFAEMSLDKDAREPATNHADLENIAIANIADAQADDQEMLDAQFEDTLPGSAIPKVSDDSLAESAKQQVEDIEDPIEDPDQPAKVTAKTKRQKRKSMPPPVVTNTDPSKPAIIIFDSLGQTRSATLKVLKEYLKAEAKIKRGGMEVDTTQINGINAKVPQQDNFSDCGLFLLGYMSKFLEDDPKDFITKIIKRQYTRKEDWTNLKPSIMRADLRDQIQELYKVQKDEERESAIKAGKYKGDQKPQSSPTPAPFGRNEKSNRDGQKKEAKQERTKKDENASTGKSTPKSTLDPPRLEGDMLDGLAAQLDREAQNTSKVAKPTHEGDSGNKQAERVRQNTERDIEASAAPVGDSHHRGDTPRTRKPLADLASTEPNVPCVIEIESQSQQGASVLRSVRHSQHSFEKRDESELPSEVPDSQPSNPAKISPQVVIPLQSPKKNLTSPERSETSKSFEQIVSVSAKPSRILDALTGSVAQTTSTKKTYGKSSKPQGERSDRASRRKTTTNMLRSTGVDEVIDIDD